IVVPKPRDTNRYYVFTADAADHDFTNGYRYSEVDMTLNGGLGDVTANRNVLLYTPCTEKLAAVRHPNGIDYWVITKEWNNNRYRVYKIDCGGINTTPIISDLSVINNPDVYGVGMNFAEAVIALNGRLCFAGLPAIIGNSTAAPLPPIDFTYSFINCYVQFSGTTNGLSGTFRWHWDFGDGVTDTFQTVRHSYRGSGSYNVQLTVYSTSPCGVSDTFRISKPVIINNVFSVDFLNTGN